MTITLKLIDDHGNELHINDVVMIEYTNPLLKYVGVLKFDEEQLRLVVSDNDDGYQPFPRNDWESIKLIGTDIDITKVEKYFGRSEFTSRKKMQNFLTDLEELIEFLSAKIKPTDAAVNTLSAEG